jgi:APA family basic amino acid/polyamine antiporter
MSLVRTIGRWAFTALIVNTIIGSGIFGIPSELNAIVGRASPIAMLLAGLGMGIMMACFAEVASQFTEPGGAYLYTRTAFGRFVGMQVAWFSWLAPMAATAAGANLLAIYLAGFFPATASGIGRAAVLTVLIGFLASANYIGIRTGTGLNNVFTVAKLLPLGLLIVLGLVHFAKHPEAIRVGEIASPGIGGWVDALLLLAFAYAGFENVMIPMGEVKNPRRTVPFSLAIGLLLCMTIYALIQFIVVVTIGTGHIDRPLAATAGVLIGSSGAMFVTIAAMLSSYGNLSAIMLATPRLTYSLAEQHDFPGFFGKIHPRFKTPHVSIVILSVLTWILAVSGTFRWALALASGAVIIIYASVCASLIRLRQLHPSVDALRLPFGYGFAVTGMAVALILLTRLTLKEGFLLILTAGLATVNWVWARRNFPSPSDSTAVHLTSAPH